MFGKKTPQEPLKDDQGAADLKKLLEDLPGAIQTSVATGMATAMKGMQQQQQPAPKKEPPKKDELPPIIPDGTDIDEYTPTQLLDVISQVIDRKFNEFNEVVEPKFQELTNKAQTKDIQDQVKEVAKDNPDFWKYRDVMGGIAKQYPHLAPADLFDLAKAKAPEIGAEIQKEKDDKDAEDAKKNVVSFGGLTPTSGHSSEDSEGMDFTTASEKAWEEVMSQVPTELIGGTNN